MWDFPLFPDQASTNARHIDGLYFFELGLSFFMVIVIAFLVIAFAIRYRRGTRVDRTNPPASSKVMEGLWIGLPLILFMGMFTWSTEVFNKVFSPPADATEIYVVGKQWMWYIQHPEGRREINELHVPVGRPVKLKMTSQDVIHSFFVPAFRTKQDVLPGRFTEMWFEPTKIGKYRLLCAEYCGTNHSLMGGWVYVMNQADYDQWLKRESMGQSMASEGKELFTKYHCAGCHGANASVEAPKLEGIFGKPVPIQNQESGEVSFVQADDRYIRDSILQPKGQVVAGYKPIMPSYQWMLEEPNLEGDLLKLVEYIKSLSAEVAR